MKKKKMEEENIELKFNLKETERYEALEIMNFLIGYHEVKEDELDFSE